MLPPKLQMGIGGRGSVQCQDLTPGPLDLSGDATVWLVRQGTREARIASPLCCLLLVFLVASGAAADKDSEAALEDRPPRHRIDFGLQWFDAAEGDTVTGSLEYAWVPLAHHGFSASVLLVGSDVSDTEGSGIGDIRLQYSWVPSANLTAASWVPNTLGMGFGLIVPTGDPAKGTGVDRWIAIPTLGWVFNINERFSILPTLQYLQSFNEASEADKLSAMNLELGLLYVTKSELWINYTPSLFRDFEPIDDTNLDHFLTIGKQFTRTFGSSLTLGAIERPPVQDAAVARSSDQFAQITLHFVLPG
jgi:hypothetical protein